MKLDLNDLPTFINSFDDIKEFNQYDSILLKVLVNMGFKNIKIYGIGGLIEFTGLIDYYIVYSSNIFSINYSGEIIIELNKLSINNIENKINLIKKQLNLINDEIKEIENRINNALG
jgi:hypothetical protein